MSKHLQSAFFLLLQFEYTTVPRKEHLVTILLKNFAMSGGFFGFSTEMPLLRPEELVLLDQEMSALGGLEEKGIDVNVDTFGDIDELGMHFRAGQVAHTLPRSY